MIEIKNRELFIDGMSAGSVEDALPNYPDLVPEIWALMIERNNSREALEIDLDNTKSEIAALNSRLLEQSNELLALTEASAVLANDAAKAKDLQAELDALKNTQMQENMRVISPSEFMRRFSDEQLTAIATCGMSDPILSVFMMKLSTARSINLDAVETSAGLDYLDSIGIQFDRAKF